MMHVTSIAFQTQLLRESAVGDEQLGGLLDVGLGDAVSLTELAHARLDWSYSGHVDDSPHRSF
eukprot:16442468-Heterocapsa_arctica.AAC.1